MPGGLGNGVVVKFASGLVGKASLYDSGRILERECTYIMSTRVDENCTVDTQFALLSPFQYRHLLALAKFDYVKTLQAEKW